MVIAAAQKRVKRPSATQRPPSVSRTIRVTASGSAGWMPRLMSAISAVLLMPIMSFGQPCGMIIRPTVRRISSQDSGSTSGELTILFADLRGFMAISNRYPPETVLQVLNRCLVTMIDVVFAHEGTIDKFMGDSIMAHFSESSSGKEPAQRAVLCALGLQLAMDALNAEHQRSGLPELFLGIGINTGPVLVGTLGSELYRTHTVIGEEVNIAARIEALSLRGQVLLSETTYQRCSTLAKTGEPFSVHVKGKAEPIVVRELLEIPSLNRAVPRRDIRKSPRVNVAIGFSYQVVHADVTVPQVHKGVIRVLGYHGLLAETKAPL